MAGIYGWNLYLIILIMFAFVLFCLFLSCVIPYRVWRWLNVLLSVISFILIIKFTVSGRVPGDLHDYRFAAEYTNEFYREMLMNVFLYFPLGLTLSAVVGPWAVLVGLLLSFSIETWQYFAGTGLAQGTDVICNTLGSVMGTLPCVRVVIIPCLRRLYEYLRTKHKQKNSEL